MILQLQQGADGDVAVAEAAGAADCALIALAKSLLSEWAKTCQHSVVASLPAHSVWQVCMWCDM